LKHLPKTPPGFSKINVFGNKEESRLDDGAALLFPARHAVLCVERPDRWWIK
jgi:hypothetical protein